MKQKRKVKCLINEIQDRKSFVLMTLLLILSLILCLWTASLITSTVWAAGENNIYSYTWLDNNKEVLYEMKFVDPSDLTETVNTISIQDKNLYIWPSSLVVNPISGNDIDRSVNVVKTWVYSHILWWRNNKVNAENITLVAWSGNEIPSSINDNPAILWWEWNKFDTSSIWPGSTSEPIVSIWWQNNTLNSETDFWEIFIWWSGNVAYRGATMLWWQNNLVNQWISSVIVWWRNVITYGNIENIFVYSNSDDDFNPKSSNAFYLNMEKWVWINTTWDFKWLSVEGAVRLQDIHGSIESCEESNLWVMISYRWCILWCTEAWANVRKWELLDGWANCKDLFENNSHVIIEANTTSEESEEIEKFEYRAQCANNINTSHTVLCSLRDTNVRYYNVVFESVLIDSDIPCPVWRENQCIYKCEPGFHLTWSVESGNLQCYRDCPLPWEPTKKIKHNETTVRYNLNQVECSNDTYVFPRWSEIINKPHRSYTIDSSNIEFPNRVLNWISPETCTSHDHQKTLICNDWILYLMKSDWQPDFTSTGEAQNYKHASCSLREYRCNTWVYNLTQEQFRNEKEDEPKNGWATVDRWIQEWTRWIYEVCIDYNPEPTNPAQNWSSCSVAQYHYKFKECQPGYELRSDGVCRKECELSEINGGSSWYVHGTVVTGYQDKSVTCTWTCQSASIVCNDGNRRLWSMSGEITTGYSYNDCNLINKTCDASVFNVTGMIYNQWSGTSYYEPCESYNADGKFACTFVDTWYHLTWCHEWYHAVGGKYCVPNWEKLDCPQKPLYSHWIREWGITLDYPWSNIFSGIFVESWRYIRWWNWQRDAINKWGTTKYPEEKACVWECDRGHHEGTVNNEPGCPSNICTWQKPHWIAVHTWDDWPRGNSNLPWEYSTWKQESELLICEWSCENGYHQSTGNTCEINECLWRKPTWAWVISWGIHPSGYENTWWVYNISGYIAGTLWVCEWSCKDGYHRNSAWTGCALNECRYCANNSSTNVWFPYCFPIDFSETCRENDYYYSNNT